MSYRKLLSILSAAGILLVAGPAARAGKWEIAPLIEVGAVYNDNYSLLAPPSPKDDVAGGKAEVELAFLNRGPRTEFEVVPRIEATFFPNDSEAESDDYFLDTRWQHQTLRSIWRFQGNLSRESIVESESLSSDALGVELGESVGGDGGRISVRTIQNLVSLQPFYTFQFSKRTQLELTGRFFQAEFDHEAAVLAEQVDFKDIGGSAGLTFRTSPVTNLTVRATASTFDPDNTSTNTDRLGAELQWTTRRTEKREVYLRGGVRRTEFADGQSATGFVGGAGSKWRQETGRVLLDIIRSVEPSAVGRVVNRDELRVQLERDMSARWSTFANLRAVRMEVSLADSQAPDDADKDYLIAAIGFRWRMRRQFTVIGDYEYRRQEFKTDPSAASSNGVGLTLVYEPRRRE